MDSLASRRHRSRCPTPVAWIAVLVAAAALGGCDAVVCSQSQQGELTTLVDANKSIFQACGANLKLSASSTSSDALASFIHEDYLQDTNADRICASDNCVRALIQAMESLPDCCSQVASATRNLPRLADDILHQCDVRDAKKLASELEAEIAKLPDLKVQIKSLGTGKGSSVSGSGDSAVVGDGVDVIIDVKKRELMKTGGLGLTPSDGQANSSSTVAASSNSASALPSVSALILALCTAAQLLLWQ